MPSDELTKAAGWKSDRSCDPLHSFRANTPAPLEKFARTPKKSFATQSERKRPPTEAAYLRWQIGSMLSVVQCQAGPKPQLNRRLLVTGKRGIRNGIDSMASTKTARKMIAPLSPFLPGRRSLMTGKLGQCDY